MSNLEDMQDLLDRAKSYRAGLSKPALDSSFIKNIDFNNISKQTGTDTNNMYVKCRISRKKAKNGCVRNVKIPASKGKENISIQVNIPAGVVNGQQIIIRNDIRSNLVIKIIVK